MTEVNIDVIILSNTVSLKHANVLRDTVNSIRDNPKKFKFNIIVVESNKQLNENSELKKITDKLKVDFITPKQKFHYNLFLNKGLRKCKGDFILISNNDVVYSKNWFVEMYKQFEKDKELMSACPIDRKWHRHSEELFPVGEEIYYGVRTSFEFTGWCFVWRKELIQTLGYFDERFKFYYQDNDISCMLSLFNIKHGLVTTSHAHHLLSQSHDIVEPDYRNMQSQKIPMLEKWGGIFFTEHGEVQKITTTENLEKIKRNIKYKRLSILVCSLPDREKYLNRLKKCLEKQLTLEVEIIADFSGRGEKTIGDKRADLITQANGEYVCFIDDDDFVCDDYVEKILKATDNKPDVVGFNTLIIFDGKNPRLVQNSLSNPTWYNLNGNVPWSSEKQPVVFYRCPGHLTPVKREIALKSCLMSSNNEEDKVYAATVSMNCFEEVYINEYMYFYDCKTKKEAGQLIDLTEEELIDLYNKREELKQEANKLLEMNKLVDLIKK